MRYTKPQDSEKRSFKPYPEGLYDIEITKVEEGVSSKAKSPQLIIKGTIVDGPQANKKVTMYLSLVPAAVWKVEQIFEAAGLEEKDTGEVDDEGNAVLTINEQELVGRTLMFEAEIEEWNKKKKNEWWCKGVSEVDAKGSATGKGSDDSDDDDDDSDDFVDEEEHLAGAQPATGNTGTKQRPRRPAKRPS